MSRKTKRESQKWRKCTVCSSRWRKVRMLQLQRMKIRRMINRKWKLPCGIPRETLIKLLIQPSSKMPHKCSNNSSNSSEWWCRCRCNSSSNNSRVKTSKTCSTNNSNSNNRCIRKPCSNSNRCKIFWLRSPWWVKSTGQCWQAGQAIMAQPPRSLISTRTASCQTTQILPRPSTWSATFTRSTPRSSYPSISTRISTSLGMLRRLSTLGVNVCKVCLALKWLEQHKTTWVQQTETMIKSWRI